MAEHQIAPIREYETLEDFSRGQNNFYMYFLDDCGWGRLYRKTSHFQRFQEQHSEMEQKTRMVTVQAVRAEPRQELPYEQLWEAYKIMSKLVFLDDKYVMRDDQPDAWFLCR